jgi:hypothetical protein
LEKREAFEGLILSSAKQKILDAGTWENLEKQENCPGNRQVWQSK